MKIQVLATRYLIWHYTEALTDWWQIVGNFIWFFFHMFSIGLLTKTLFSPFKRMTDERKKGSFKFEDWGGAIIVNLLMRLIGVGIRTVIIVMGLIFLLATVVVGALAFIIWLILPPAIIFLVVFGLTEIFYLP